MHGLHTIMTHGAPQKSLFNLYIFSENLKNSVSKLSVCGSNLIVYALFCTKFSKSQQELNIYYNESDTPGNKQKKNIPLAKQ